MIQDAPIYIKKKAPSRHDFFFLSLSSLNQRTTGFLQARKNERLPARLLPWSVKSSPYLLPLLASVILPSTFSLTRCPPREVNPVWEKKEKDEEEKEEVELDEQPAQEEVRTDNAVFCGVHWCASGVLCDVSLYLRTRLCACLSDVPVCLPARREVCCAVCV